MISDNAVYWILLTRALGYNSPKFKKISEMYSSVPDFIRAGESEWKFCGIFNSSDIERLNKAKAADAEKILDRCRQLGYSVLALDDADYPQRLYNIYAPPAVLYISGSLPDFDERLSIGIVGTRRASRYAIENSYKFAYALSKFNAVTVSGGALGVDCASHRGALAAGGVTVCVRGCGINSRYLRDNEKMRQAITVRGAVISEYPPDTEPRSFYFPARNRIIAALSDGVLLIEAGVKSGSLITANLALDMGKDLFALLSSNDPRNEGSNNRIKEGTAVPVTDFMDIIAYYDSGRFGASSDQLDFDGILFADIEAVPVKKEARQPEKAKPKPENTAGKKSEKPKESEKPEKAEEKTKKQPYREIEISGDAEKVYKCLSAQPVHIDIIAEKSGLSVSRVLVTLTLLELQGAVRSLPGRKFNLKEEIYVRFGNSGVSCQSKDN